MAIHQRDRNFHFLFSQIEVDVIPLKFVREVVCHLNGGKQITLTETDFSKEDLAIKDLESIVRELPFYEQMCDLSIRIDYNLVEKAVSKKVANLLTFPKND
jgi:hypothetical protein